MAGHLVRSLARYFRVKIVRMYRSALPWSSNIFYPRPNKPRFYDTLSLSNWPIGEGLKLRYYGFLFAIYLSISSLWQWLKFQIYEVQHQWSSPEPTKLRFKLNMHYMWNVATHQVHQAKLKNSYESGCQGVRGPAN
jgi:hypothetical protein